MKIPRRTVELAAMEVEARLHDLQAEYTVGRPMKKKAHRRIAKLIRAEVKAPREKWGED